MRRVTTITLLLSLALLWGCARTVRVTVPPRMDLTSYGTLGIIEFASNSGPAISLHATRQFQEQVQAAQPGTPFIELGNREQVLAAVGGTQVDVDVLKKLGKKYGVAGIFVGEITYSEPTTDIKVTDQSKLEGGLRTEIRADVSGRLFETGTGASVWSSSAWARKQIGRVSLSAERGVRAGVSSSNPRREMVPGLIHHLTGDFRPTSVRRRAN